MDSAEKLNGTMVAEDGNSYEKCSQIADIALKIESVIKELTEQELRDEIVIKVVLKKCFEGMNDISSMAEGNNLDRLTDRMMELIRELYM